MGRLNPPVNWAEQMKNFIDSYPLDTVSGVNPDTDLAHALQKDAIQNSLDAIDEENPHDLTVKLEVDDIADPTYLSITDKGTTGLTGRPSLRRSELERIKDKERYEWERWSRMQALGYKNPDIDARGARGQGKFIFIGSSENGEMIFDTLRADGIYRVGHWETDKNEPLMDPLEGEEAEKYIDRKVNLEPLEEIGTRIIIPQPRTEVWKAFWGYDGDRGGDMYRYISSTWWEALKNGRSIILQVEGEGEREVNPPKLYRHFRDDSDYFKHIRKTGVGKPFQEKFSGCMVKELVIAYSEEKVPEELRGIAIQRGEMTVERFDPLHGNTHLPASLKDHIFGWLILNRKGDRELKKTEVSSHYHFAQKRGSLALKLLGRNGWLSRQVEEFAEKELGYAAGGRDVTGSYSKAVNLLNQMAKSVGYENPARIGGSQKRESSKKKGNIRKKMLRAQLRVDYPTENSRRVEFGEKVSVKSRISNYSDIPQDYEFKVTLKRKEGFRKENEEELSGLVAKEGTLEAKGKTDWLGKTTFNFAKSTYSEGTYVISALVTNPNTKGTIHELRKLVYLNTDPPLERGIFKELEVDTFQPPDNRLQYKVKPDTDKKLTLIINDAHTLYDLNSEKGDPTVEYVIECGTNALLERDFTTERKLVEERSLSGIEELMEKDIEQFDDSVAETARARQEFLFDAFRKRVKNS